MASPGSGERRLPARLVSPVAGAYAVSVTCYPESPHGPSARQGMAGSRNQIIKMRYFLLRCRKCVCVFSRIKSDDLFLYAPSEPSNGLRNEITARKTVSGNS